MKYRITHDTLYQYNQLVGLCQNEARLQPRDSHAQQCLYTCFDIEPEPNDYSERVDYFGNRVAYFAVQQAHQRLSVKAVSEVSVEPQQSGRDTAGTARWEEVCACLQEAPDTQASESIADELLSAKFFLGDSPLVAGGPALADYARPSFLPGRPLAEAVDDLMRRIHRDFTYDPSFTTVATPLADILRYRRGVCQDFAHLAIGCLRSFGIAARYVSGYLETEPAPGKPRLVGADASHAWFSVYLPDGVWLDFDPTNNTVPFDRHITLAWGRDYSDVAPLKGIAFGGGQHTLSVSVDVARLE